MKRSLSIFLLAFLVASITACSDATGTGPTSSSSSSSQTSTASVLMNSGSFHEYRLPQNNSGLMRPAIDSTGRLWFGEMNRNYLTSFDPHTGKFLQSTPPRGRSGIMGITLASDDTVWFAEQYANYIGHYVPTTGQYRIYPLPTLTVPDPANAGKKLTLPVAPNDVALDAHGNLWFTELNAGIIGRLNTADGSLHQYQIAPGKDPQSLNLYGIAVDPQGKVWFTEVSSNPIGRLDPATGQVAYFTPPGPARPLMEIASDPRGLIWATSFNAGLLLSLDPVSGTFTSYYAPSSDGNAGGLYGLWVMPQGDVWITESSGNIIARLDVKAHHFLYYTIPTPGSLPLGVVMDKSQHVWFTEAATDKIGVLQP